MSKQLKQLKRISSLLLTLILCLTPLPGGVAENTGAQYTATLSFSMASDSLLQNEWFYTEYFGELANYGESFEALTPLQDLLASLSVRLVVSQGIGGDLYLSLDGEDVLTFHLRRGENRTAYLGSNLLNGSAIVLTEEDALALIDEMSLDGWTSACLKLLSDELIDGSVTQLLGDFSTVVLSKLKQYLKQVFASNVSPVSDIDLIRLMPKLSSGDYDRYTQHGSFLPLYGLAVDERDASYLDQFMDYPALRVLAMMITQSPYKPIDQQYMMRLKQEYNDLWNALRSGEQIMEVGFDDDDRPVVVGYGIDPYFSMTYKRKTTDTGVAHRFELEYPNKLGGGLAGIIQTDETQLLAAELSFPSLQMQRLCVGFAVPEIVSVPTENGFRTAADIYMYDPTHRVADGQSNSCVRTSDGALHETYGVMHLTIDTAPTALAAYPAIDSRDSAMLLYASQQDTYSFFNALEAHLALSAVDILQHLPESVVLLLIDALS